MVLLSASMQVEITGIVVYNVVTIVIYFIGINFRGCKLSRFCEFFWHPRKFIPSYGDKLYV